MPSQMVFDVATLSDAVTKAARVAPTKGPAFDTAGGLFISVKPDSREAIIRATDLTVTFEQRIDAISGKGDAAEWRIPSRLFADVIASLPMTDDSQVTLIDRNDEAIRLSCDRVKAKFHRLDADSYPLPAPFDKNDMLTAHDFASKVEQVAWACDPSSDRLSGVFVDGNRLVGCSSNAMAIVPCIVPVAQSVIVPLTTMAPLLKQASDLRVKAVERKFLMQLDQDTQASSVLIEGSYPNVDHVARTDFTASVEINKNSVANILDRMLNLIRQDRQPRMRVEINGSGMLKEMVFDVDVSGVGRMQDSIDIVTDFDDTFEILITPMNLSKPINAAKGDRLHLHFGHPDPKRAPKSSFMIEDPKTHYQCWTMPLDPSAKGK